MLVAVLATSPLLAEWGQTPRLTVVGNHLEDPEGNQVMLHGVMDTPSPYFSGYRFTDGNWIDVYRDGDKYIDKCKNYFDKLFTAITDTKQGSWCNVFRLHLDPCWTDDPNVRTDGFSEKNNKVYDPHGNEVSGEANIYHFSKSRLVKYLDKLYLPLAELAKGHGLYVIMRPPGVCPGTIQVGDYYQKYLMTVWDEVTKNKTVLANSDWLSIELANEPVGLLDQNGKDTDQAMHDFFQPIVDKIRANGFKGIIWVPGKTWQQNYKGYKRYPIEGENIGYAVHFYPGWYNTSDTQHNPSTSIEAFLSSVPVVKTNPIMITEVDWSPEDPNGQGHFNESGAWVKPNCGTWATGSTSKFGEGYKAVLEYFDNIGMTLTHTHDYIDIDRYLKDKKLLPAFHDKLANNAYEACSGGCFAWYPEFAKAKHTARTDFSDYEIVYTPDKYFPLDAKSINTDIWEKGSYDEATHTLTTGQYGFGGWTYRDGLDLSEYNYIVLQFNEKVKDSGQWSACFRLFDADNYWGGCASYNLGGKKEVVVDLHDMKKDDGTPVDPSHIYIAGFWTLGGSDNSVSIGNIFVSNDGKNPVTSLSSLISDDAPVIETLQIDGRPASSHATGLLLKRSADGKVRKVFVK